VPWEASGSAPARASSERTESVRRVDGHLVLERETRFLPIAWSWDPKGHATPCTSFSAAVPGPSLSGQATSP